MDSIREFFKRIKDRPSIYLVMLALTFVFSAAEAYNPVIRRYGSFGYVFEHNYMKNALGLDGKGGCFFCCGFWCVFLYYDCAFVCLRFVRSCVGRTFRVCQRIDVCGKRAKEKARRIPLWNKAEFSENYGLYFSCSHTFRPVFLYADLFRYPAVSMLMMFFDGNSGVIFTMLLLCVLTVAADASGDCFLRHVFFLCSSVNRRP